ncbi:MAG TPA: hypothetical protein VFF95_01765 [Candidatus Binatus sp.]|nr:hypothetical protein [Candidatus Binatus sp.]
MPDLIFRPAVQQDEQALLRGYADRARFVVASLLKPGEVLSGSS